MNNKVISICLCASRTFTHLENRPNNSIIIIIGIESNLTGDFFPRLYMGATENSLAGHIHAPCHEGTLYCILTGTGTDAGKI